ncbi:hypothetical protein ANCCEY_00296 [Ancylostoma ceylanicum]|uniref:Uncharacterized protein n=1 Tax=Ancylostoma ceylanicum TaxID=53326 RepID=A0A0D6MDF7_9BILA|nr:hypothetical protein ANCCEY_00296 [Ancylostoma ceylanicum]
MGVMQILRILQKWAVSGYPRLCKHTVPQYPGILVLQSVLTLALLQCRLNPEEIRNTNSAKLILPLISEYLQFILYSIWLLSLAVYGEEIEIRKSMTHANEILVEGVEIEEERPKNHVEKCVPTKSVTVKSTDMSEDMQQEAIAVAHRAIEQFQLEKYKYYW